MTADDRALLRPVPALRLCALVSLLLACGALAGGAQAQSLASKAKASGGVDAPRVVEGRTNRCTTASGVAAYFNVPDASDSAPPRGPSSRNGSGGPASAAGFPRVDPATQRSRDDMRRRVLGDELASEEKLLAEARAAYGAGAPAVLPDEQAHPQKYADRVARLRQAVQLHERNVEALRKELGGAR